MFTKLRIQNFKGWKDTGEIRMAPITLFFGANSSGKSSIGQFLMLLKQTVESPDRRAVLYPGGKNSAVQLGSYDQMVYSHDKGLNITLEYQWNLSDALNIKDPISKQSISGNKLHFEAKIGLDNGSLSVDCLKYNLTNGNDTALTIGYNRQGTEAKPKFEVNAKHYSLIRKQGRVWPLGAPVRFYGFPDEVIAYYQNAEFTQELNLQHEKLFRSLNYLGPLRTKAERLYSWTGIEPESVGYAGENTVAAILAAHNRKIGLSYRSRYKPFEGIIAHQLKQMELIEEFKVNRISEQRQEYEVKLRTKGSKDWVDIPDVGFGICQVLPVLVQCFYAPAGSVILMEQPEIHLHPSAQSALADVVIDAINSRENGDGRNIQLIIETHSEHFLRRLQRKIAEGKILGEQVEAYFADITKAPARLEPLKLDLYGNIANWPDNFFGDPMSDVIRQSEAAMKKRLANGLSEPELPFEKTA